MPTTRNTHARVTAFRNSPITASVRPDLRGVFAFDVEGLTMRWIVAPREAGNFTPRDGMPTATSRASLESPGATR